MSADPPTSLIQKLTAPRGGAIALIAGSSLVAAERAFSDSGALSIRAMLAWWGANVGIALIVWLIAAASQLLSQRIARTSARAHALGAFLFGLGVALLAGPLGESLTGGGWISQQSWGWLLRYAPSVAAFGTGFVVWLATARAPERFRGPLAVALAVAGIAAVGTDHRVLLGTYPDAHLLLHLLALMAFVAALALLVAVPRSRNGRVAASLALLGALAAPALWLTVPLGHRPQLSMSSQMASLLMERTMPRIELQFAEREFAQVDPDAGRYLPAESGTHLDRKDWNVLWITVDTLRWDALWPARPEGGRAFARATDTPFLNDWLAKSVVFERAYAQSSATHRSMPPMFKSLEAYEPTLDLGTPLGTAASRTGRTSIAVVNNFFLEPRFKRSQSLLWGFDVVEIYHKQHQEDLVVLLDDALKAHGERGFFAWLHFYNMHEPGYGAEGLQSKGALSARYRKSLRWLDAQMKAVIAVVERRGFANDTIVVFSADHGESIGANRITNHGPTIYEEEIRVPLVFHIPGVAPRRIPQTVGNLDIVPTLWDAMGVPPAATFRGRSVLGPIVGDGEHAQVPYYMENANGDIAGIALGSQKLIHKLKSGTTMRFDTAVDPTEDNNIFTDGPDDSALLAALYAKNPELVVVTPLMGAVATEQIRAVDPRQPGAALRYLLNVAARADDRDARRALETLLEQTPHERVKLEVLAAIKGVNSDRASALAAQELGRIAPGAEAPFVEGLAEIGIDAIDTQIVERRFRADSSDDVAQAWIHWMLRWKDPSIGAVLVRFAAAVRQRPTPSAETLRALAELIRSAKLSKSELSALLEFNRWLLERTDPRVLPEAVATAGEMGDKAAAPKVAALAAHGGIRTKQAALYALAQLRGADAVDVIVAAGADPNLVLDAVKALELTRSKRALPFVQDVADNHYNWIIRNNAKGVAKKLTQ